jgi:hypothetical protein
MADDQFYRGPEVDCLIFGERFEIIASKLAPTGECVPL